MDFRPLASSSAGCAYLLSVAGGPSLLIDCGVRFRAIQEATGFQVTKLAGCLVTHEHQDHCRAVPDMLSAGVEVFASAGTWKAMLKGRLLGHHNAKVVKEGVVYDIGPYKVRPFDLVHDAAEPLGFYVAGPDDRLVYLTDTAYSKYKFADATIMALEANWGEEEIRESRLDSHRFTRTTSNHMSIERLIRMLQANDLSNVREIHLLHLSDQNSDAASFKEEVQRATGKLVFVAPKSGRMTPQSQGGV